MLKSNQSDQSFRYTGCYYNSPPVLQGACTACHRHAVYVVTADLNSLLAGLPPNMQPSLCSDQPEDLGWISHPHSLQSRFLHHPVHCCCHHLFPERDTSFLHMCYTRHCCIICSLTACHTTQSSGDQASHGEVYSRQNVQR